VYIYSTVYLEGLLVESPAAHVVVAGVDERHGGRQGRQLRDPVLPDHQLLQGGQRRERRLVDGRDVVGRHIDALQLVWGGGGLKRVE